MFLEGINISKIILKFREAKLLQVEINKTNALITAAKTALTGLGISTTNLLRIAYQIKTSSTPIEQTHFNKVSNTISVSPTEVNPALDQSLRPIFATLVVRDISATKVEETKTAMINNIAKEVLKYGVKKAEFFSVLKKITETQVQLNYYSYSLDGYLLEFGDVEDPYQEIVDVETVVLKFDVVGSSGFLAEDSSLVGLDGATLFSSGNAEVMQDGDRRIAKFYGAEGYGYEYISVTAAPDQKLVPTGNSVSVETDFKFTYEPEFDTSPFKPSFKGTFLSMNGLFNFSLQKWDYATPTLLLQVPGNVTFRISDMQDNVWYKIKIDFWFENGVYRKQLEIINLTNNEARYGLVESGSYYGSVITDVTSTVATVGHQNVGLPALYNMGIAYSFDNFKIYTKESFQKPAYTKFFDQAKTSANASLTNTRQNLKIGTASELWQNSVSEESAYSGRKYFEVTNVTNNANGLIVGLISDATENLIEDNFPGKFPNSWGIFANRALGVGVYEGQGSVGSYNANTGLSPIAQGGVVRVAVDFSTGQIWFGLNEKWEDRSGTETFPAPPNNSFYYSFNPALALKIFVAVRGTTQEASINVGNKPFAYPIPDRFVAWGDIGVI